MSISDTIHKILPELIEQYTRADWEHCIHLFFWNFAAEKMMSRWDVRMCLREKRKREGQIESLRQREIEQELILFLNIALKNFSVLFIWCRHVRPHFEVKNFRIISCR